MIQIMAGKRHHILPRFLMKGFASRTTNNGVFVWAYRKMTSPFELNIINVNVEKGFYGTSVEEWDADKPITVVERDFAELIDNLRSNSNGIVQCSNRITDFIAHLFIRTKNTRQSAIIFGEEFLPKFLDFFYNPTNLIKLFSKRSIYEASVRKHMPHLDDISQRQMVDILCHQVEAQIRANIDSIMSEKLISKEELQKTLPSLAREAHNKTLVERTIPDDEIERYNSLNWFVVNTGSQLLLGDVGCIFETVGDRRFRPLALKDDEIINIFLPISTNQLVVGTKQDYPGNLDIEQINIASVKCSHENFISSETSESLIKVKSKIGEWFGVLSPSEIDSLLEELFTELPDVLLKD